MSVMQRPPALWAVKIRGTNAPKANDVVGQKQGCGPATMQRMLR